MALKTVPAMIGLFLFGCHI